jgi:sugar lactone lactonase YvrE
MEPRAMKMCVLIVALVIGLASASAQAGLLYVTQGNDVVAYDVSLGTGSAVAASATTVVSANPNLVNAQGIVFDSTGSFYVASLATNSVAKFNAFGTYVSSITELVSFPTALAINSSNNLFVAGNDIQHNARYSIVEYPYGGGNVSSISNLPNTIGALAISSSGSLYVGYEINSGNRIEIFGTDLAPSGGIGSPANWVAGLAFNASGSLYASNLLGNAIEVFNSSNQHTGQIGTAASPSSLAVDPSGNLYVITGSTGNAIAKYDSSGQFQYSWNVNGGASLTYGPVLVPEPSTWAMAAMAIAVGGWRTWRGRRRPPSAARTAAFSSGRGALPHGRARAADANPRGRGAGLAGDRKWLGLPGFIPELEKGQR